MEMNKQDLMRKRNDAIRTVRHSNKVVIVKEKYKLLIHINEVE